MSLIFTYPMDLLHILAPTGLIVKDSQREERGHVEPPVVNQYASRKEVDHGREVEPELSG